MADPGTDTLRKLAPCWSLAGDDQLLTLLENTHKRLISKCEEANSQLEQMASALNDANISLQNVNNQFMALSSSQFIESRVYDDDDSTEIPVVKEPPAPSVPDEVSSLKRSVQVLQAAHEVITILNDSDTESDTEDEMTDRVVLKPKDVYADRPLPYIIGSQPWKNKWHAGLIAEDSDSDSSTCKVDRDSDQYSQSEPEDVQTDKLHVSEVLDTTISETSSELPSEQGSVHKPTPSDVASEIARRLGGGIPTKPVEKEPEYEEPAKPAVRKVYRPHEPITSTIFPDEPPPLSDPSDAESDIFADLHRSQPYSRTQAAEDLFSFNNDEQNEEDIFSDFANKPTSNPSTNPTSLFDSGPKPHMFEHGKLNHVPPGHTEHTYDTPQSDKTPADTDRDRGVKKPVGGISLFGNKGTESIGAAILKRNQRKSSTSGDDSGSDIATEPTQPQIKKEKDIFDDLFARSEVKNKKVVKENNVIKNIATEIKSKQTAKKITAEKIKEKPVEKAKVDLFSDNLFDDIDDIFTTNVVKMPSKSQEKPKSIFDDDDDLFSEITAPKSMKPEASNSSNKKGLFDSDDELFSDNITTHKNEKQPSVTEKPVKIVEKLTKTPESNVVNKLVSKSIFEDEEDDIFSDVKLSNNTNITLVAKDNNLNKPINNVNTEVFKSPSLFDDEDDENGIFGESPKSTQKEISSKFENQPTTRNLEENIEVKAPNPVNNDFTEETIVKNDNSINNNNASLINNATKPTKSLSVQEISIISENNKIEEPPTLSEKSEVPNAAKIFDQIATSSSENDDFSDQDFDDLPTKDTPKTDLNSNLKDTEHKNAEVNIPTEPKNPQILESANIFDKKPLQNDIFVEKEITDTLFKTTEPEITTNKTENDNNNIPKTTNAVDKDIFNDILTEPPVFEKPKEPKRSKNVNALFDDDSDDESLFFKKNDVITDEKPEDFKPANDRIFGLFTDEPPDDGFSKISDDFDDDLFSTLPKPKVPTSEVLPPLPNTDFEGNIPSIENKETNSKKVDTIEDDFIIETPKTAVNTSKENQRKTEISKDTLLPSTEKESTNTYSDEDIFKTTKIETNVKAKPKQLDILSDDDELFGSIPPINKTIEHKKPELETKLSDDELFKTENRINKNKQEIPKQDTDSKSDEDIFKKTTNKVDLPEQKNTEDVVKVEKSEPRKVGKLKVGLNINVNALLPGASPKKVVLPKPNDQTDGQAQSVTETPKTAAKVTENQNPDSKLVKSVSFDSEPDSKILDNKLSKERAKIQVKRRPSTRRARREAVRKSGIDFGDDSTDNSSSIDDPPRNRTEKSNTVKIVNIDDNNAKNLDQNSVKTEVQAENIEKSNIDTKILSQNDEIAPEIEPKTKNQAEMETPTFSKDIKSKVVYILNDEDIFNTSPVKKPENNKKDLTHSSQISKDVDQNLDTNEGVSTLGKLYDTTIENVVGDIKDSKTSSENDGAVNNDPKKTTKSDLGDKKDPKISLFGEDDNEIFKGKKVVPKSSLFDSDSDEELFGSSKRKVEKQEIKKPEIKEVKTVKGSLFGDEDDDDDLFGVKPKKSVEPQPQPQRPSTKEPPKSSNPVFEDPLSMFGDED